ncbi:hypothetical protein [Streptomyces sp. NPDC059371]|uniref:hypothetical protein n=1 Tax=Streptomyces sp. NPDC059371 TaxID=3346812 RepID=UPI003676BDEA
MLDHTCRDATFELALGDLRQALEQDQYTPMAEQLRKTQDRLAELITLDPDRLDAQLTTPPSTPFSACPPLTLPHASAQPHPSCAGLGARSLFARRSGGNACVQAFGLFHWVSGWERRR